MKWLWKHESTDPPHETLETGTDRTINKKQPASRDLRLLQTDDNDRHRRSPNPTLSTARVHISRSQEDKSLPDTASPSSRWPDVPSTASTPRIDDTNFDLDRQDDDETSGTDTDLEEWQQ